ncbi:MAG: hydratase [Oscillospiraceae bacterium]|nr:hydratase [Oscillospiraceae bacterium]
MIKLYDSGVYLVDGKQIIENPAEAGISLSKSEAAKNTMAYSILQAHNTSGDENKLKLKFDAMASHDITFVGIVQTARASGLEKFPIPYVLTNCHNSLCAVGGTINEDDHMFGLSAAKKYGGIYVPPHMAVIHQYMREMHAGCGKMILGSDSHTRYGAIGTMAIGEGGGELVKQLLCKTYDVNYPDVVGVYLTGKPVPGVGPQDVALAIIGAVFKNGYVKNKIMEFVGDGIANLEMDFRNGIDVMTTETTCLSSIWCTDEKTQEYLAVHGRAEDYKQLEPGRVAYYDGMVYVDLSTIRPMIALPMHPSNVYEIETLNANLEDILRACEKDCIQLIDNPNIQFNLTNKIVNGKLKVDQGVIAGCAGGTYTNVNEAAQIIKGHMIGNDEYALSVYPSSQPVMMQLMKNGDIADLMAAGATIRTAFCGPCFGAGDVPANNAFSIRHTTRNFPSREGSKPSNGQISSVALMDARSIAATSINGGYLTPATDLDLNCHTPKYFFDKSSYESRIYKGYNRPNYDDLLKFGPNIVDWPTISPLSDNLLMKVVSYITDPVTTTDELIPSGETSSFRSNPLGLAEFTLSRKDPAYVGKAKAVQALDHARKAGQEADELEGVYTKIKTIKGCENINTAQMNIGSVIYAVKPGDGSAREQAASCQRVLGGCANISQEYATKRYRSNLINWGMIPFLIDGDTPFTKEDYVFVPDIRTAIMGDTSAIKAYVIGKEVKEFTLSIADMTADEKQILLDGCLINYYKHN